MTGGLKMWVDGGNNIFIHSKYAQLLKNSPSEAKIYIAKFNKNPETAQMKSRRKKDLVKEYTRRFDTKPFWWRTIEQLEEKLARD